MDDATPESRQCRICGYPLDRKNRTGLCSNRTPACRKARDHLATEEKPGKFRVVIKAGDTFGRWTALEDYDRASRTALCRCECGTERRIDGSQLVYGYTTACRSCGQKKRRKPAKEPYLKAGSVFGRLTLLEDATYASDRVLCRCEREGAEIPVRASSLKSGRTQSCGCLHRELMTKHGLSGHPYYGIWKGIIYRCENPESPGFEDYGARGVTICARWRGDVGAFVADIEREIGPRPEGRYGNGRVMYELDRTDNDGGYWCGHCPDCISRGQTVINVRWSDRPTQMQNRRTVNGLTRKLAGAVARAENAEAGKSRRAPVRRAPELALMADPLFSESDIRQ